MNISELARKLRVSPNELRHILSLVGIDIGAKAIKIDKQLAKRIINEWNSLYAQFRKIDDAQKKEKEEADKVVSQVSEIEVPSSISVRDFAVLLGVPVNKLIGLLMKSGIFVSLNERIDYDTASIIAMDLGVEVKRQTQADQDDKLSREDYLEGLLTTKKGDNLTERPPVVVVMGHVDHGKTSLLDSIRKTSVTAGEAGGITQHIGAYQVTKNKRKITFIDTPGHEAFTAMRSRGARIADIAILVVAADDGVKPQTIEAIKIIEKSKIPFIVAINKIDKEGANIEKTKKELSAHNVVTEEWGGKAVCVPISAKVGTGIDNLLEMVLLTVDIDKEKMNIVTDCPAVGTIIEAHIDKGEGAVATILVQKGTLKKGDLININKEFIGKIKSMKDYNGVEINEATPSTPVRIAGLKSVSHMGDILEVTSERSKAKKSVKSDYRIDYFSKSQEGEDDEDTGNRLNILLKADVLGSTEVIMESLEKIETKKVKIKIINRGLGNITESDILQTESIIHNQKEGSMTMLVGFNVKSSTPVDNLAKDKKVEIKIYKVIYDLLNDVKANIKKIAKIEIVQEETGRLVVKAIFKTEKKAMIIGGKVKTGKISKGERIEVWRKKEKIGDGVMENLQSGKQEVNYVEDGQECGLYYKGLPVIEVGDELIFFREVEVAPED